MDAELLNIVREHFESGGRKKELVNKLLAQGYSQAKINDALVDYSNDESTDSDDRMIASIERRFRRGEKLQDIIDSLLSDGHSQNEIDKAVQRASFSDGDVKQVIGGLSIYTYLQFGIMVACIVLGFYYNKIFWFAAGLVVLELAMGSTGLSGKERRDESSGIGFGYTNIGNFFSWWLLSPQVIVAFGFLALGVYGLIIANYVFALICFGFSGLTFLGYFMDLFSK
jgi:hypothetical protein